MPKGRTIQKVVHAVRARDDGLGALVKRSIGNKETPKFNPFLILDHFKSDGPAGFPQHPHAGQEIITYCLAGKICHEDFTGSKGILYPGDLQFMAAGKGIVHSEMPLEDNDGTNAQLLQLWIDLPNKVKDAPARYFDLREWEVPKFVSADGDITVKVVAGKSYGVESRKNLTYTGVEFYHYILKPGATFTQPVNPDYNYFLYVFKGSGLRVVNTPAKEFDNLFFNRDGDTISGSTTGDVEFVLVGGEVLEQPSIHLGPFVAVNEADINQKFVDYENSRNGFENRKTWRSLISNGVTDAMINGPLQGSPEQREKQKQQYLQYHQKPRSVDADDVNDEPYRGQTVLKHKEKELA
ncbi:hypothetical protein DIURU_004401 [Diutina rugosa]|uniref:Pirin N-terminal domain-containing protein n=1 Tax=Diutina rugosa TaxID=5481 RepID=A0A642UPQ5_DIURU|nr:uncharacterized protein DIURU_004401 [Diutina rugosa]KAA8899379.1 hypothetical protein DIURU_004401 [Diutina rugosa]